MVPRHGPAAHVMLWQPRERKREGGILGVASLGTVVGRAVRSPCMRAPQQWNLGGDAVGSDGARTKKMKEMLGLGFVERRLPFVLPERMLDRRIAVDGQDRGRTASWAESPRTRPRGRVH